MKINRFLNRTRLVSFPLITCLFALFCVSKASGSEKETSFWRLCLNGNYSAAATVGTELGAKIPPYYVLAAVCYQNMGNYYKESLMQHQYSKCAVEISKLADILNIQEETNKDNSQIYFIRGVLAGMYSGSSSETPRYYFEKSIKLDGKNPYPLHYLAMVDIAEGRLEDGAANAEKAIELKPDYAPAYVNLAGACWRMEKKDSAVRVLIECMQRCPSVPDKAYQSLVNIISEEVIVTNYANGQVYMLSVPGITDYDLRSEIIDSLKKNPKNYLELEEFYLGYENTIDPSAFLNAIEPPAELENLYNYLRARVCYLGGNNEGFDELAGGLSRNRWDDYRRLLEIGNIYYEIGHWDDAVEFYEAGFKHVDPIDSWYKLEFVSNIGTCFLQKGEYEKAEEYMLKALKLYPDDVITLMNLGIVYYKLDDYENSRRMFGKASKCETTPEQDEIIERYLNEKLK